VGSDRVNLPGVVLYVCLSEVGGVCLHLVVFVLSCFYELTVATAKALCFVHLIIKLVLAHSLICPQNSSQ
jgi:hypothetical protein